MRVVLDANVFVSAAITPHGACGKILRVILENPDEFELVLSEKIISETIASLSKPRVMKYLKLSYGPEAWVEDIVAVSTKVPDMLISFNECRDPDDVVYLAAANVAKARFIISGDRDLLVLKQYKEVDILSPGEFISFLRQALEVWKE